MNCDFEVMAFNIESCIVAPILNGILIRMMLFILGMLSGDNKSARMNIDSSAR